ncbi:hypothetical protein OQA88_4052 [Cercophora sp. LCS_1]
MHPMAASAQRQAWQKVAASTLRNIPRSPTAAAAAAARRTISASPSPRLVSRPLLQALKPAPRRTYSSGAPPPPRSSDGVKFWPFVAVIALGSGGYMLLVNRRKGIYPLPPYRGTLRRVLTCYTDMPPNPPSSAGKLPSPSKPAPTFSPSNVTVLFVLGGPGAGKGTQCARLVSEYGFTHLSAGDLLRAEQERPGSQFGQLIKDCIKNGEIVPMEVTVQLLENAMTETMQKDKNATAKHKFLIDGFPRKMDQAFKFEEVVCPAQLVLFYDCPEEEMERRLMERGKTSGRADDNAESIRKRFRTFVETSMPVVDHYEKEGRVVKVDATPKPEKVFEVTKERLGDKLGDRL